MIVARYCRVNWNRLRRLPTVKVIQRTAIIVATAIRLRRCQPRTSLTHSSMVDVRAGNTDWCKCHCCATAQAQTSHSQVTSDSDSDTDSTTGRVPKFVVTENLTRRRNDLLKKVRSLDTVSCAWTTDGRIVCLLEDGRKVTVLHERDVDTLSSGR